MVEIQNKIKEIENSGLFTPDQQAYIKYALYRNDFDANLILDNTIPAEYMGIYIKLGVSRKNISIEKYIREKWHNIGYTPDQLYFIIQADYSNIDVKNIPLNASIEQIKDFINNKKNQDSLEIAYKNSNMSFEDLKTINLLNTSNEVKKFLLRVGDDNDISQLLEIGLENYSLDQIKYLFSVLSTGSDIKVIANPNLSVEQMKEKIINSSKSLEFFGSIVESNNNRKK